MSPAPTVVHIRVGAPFGPTLCGLDPAEVESITVGQVEARRPEICAPCLSRHDQLSEELSQG